MALIQIADDPRAGLATVQIAMRKSVPKPAPDPAEHRKLARKNVLMTGVLCDANGEAASECTIHDMHTQGAAVSHGKLAVNTKVYLIDVGSNNAHEARVAWSKDDRSGLQFTRSYGLGLGLPHTLKFLFRLQFEAKLAQVRRAVAGGVPIKLALGSAGLNKEYIHQMGRHAAGDERFLRLLLIAERLLNPA